LARLDFQVVRGRAAGPPGSTATTPATGSWSILRPTTIPSSARWATTANRGTWTCSRSSATGWARCSAWGAARGGRRVGKRGQAGSGERLHQGSRLL